MQTIFKRSKNASIYNGAGGFLLVKTFPVNYALNNGQEAARRYNRHLFPVYASAENRAARKYVLLLVITRGMVRHVDLSYDR